MYSSLSVGEYLVVFSIAIPLRLFAGYLDRQRIQQYLEGHGAQVIDITWKPFGPGWFGSRERIYEVKYMTGPHVTLNATCKTSMFSGIYWTSDAPPAGLGSREKTSGAPAESIHCQEWGTQIPAGQSYCPKCGWSYQGK